MPHGVQAGLGPGDIVLDGYQLSYSPSKNKGAQQPPPTFRPMSIVAKRSPISATVELLYSILYSVQCTNCLKIAGHVHFPFRHVSFLFIICYWFLYSGEYRLSYSVIIS